MGHIYIHNHLLLCQRVVNVGCVRYVSLKEMAWYRTRDREVWGSNPVSGTDRLLLLSLVVRWWGPLSSVSVSASLSVCLSVSLSVSASFFLSRFPTLQAGSVCLSVSISLCLCLSLSLSVSVCLSPSIPLFLPSYCNETKHRKSVAQVGEY